MPYSGRSSEGAQSVPPEVHTAQAAAQSSTAPSTSAPLRLPPLHSLDFLSFLFSYYTSEYCPNLTLQQRAMVLARSLVVLVVLCAPLSSLCLQLHQDDPCFLCPDQLLPTTNDDEPLLNSLYDSLQLLHRAGNSLSLEESRERRTSPESGYRFLSQSMLRRSKMYRNGAKGGSRMTLSLDVPTSLMNILFDIAKGKSLRAQAAHNARLMAQIG